MCSSQKLLLPPGLLTTQGDEAIAVLGLLIEENHKKNKLLYKKVLHNHVQHGLLAAYSLGSDGASLKEIFAAETRELEPRKESEYGGMMTEAAVDEVLGHRENELDFIIFFEAQLLMAGHEVPKALQYWLLDREKGFLPGFIGGYAHPLIMFADAVELGSSMLAFDALALTAVDWNPLTRLITMSLPAPLIRPGSLFEILDNIRIDSSFDNIVPRPGIEHLTNILYDEPAANSVIKYLSAGDSYLSRPEFSLQVTEEMVTVAISLLTCTHVPGTPAFDFYLNHNLTFVNCLRILLPVFGCMEAKKTLLRMYWLLTILAFITQGRPVITPGLLRARDETGLASAWDQITMDTFNTKGKANPSRVFDAHFLKAVQIMRTFALEMSALEPLLLGAASKFVEEFTDWTGIGASELNTSVAIAQKSLPLTSTLSTESPKA